MKTGCKEYEICIFKTGESAEGEKRKMNTGLSNSSFFHRFILNEGVKITNHDGIFGLSGVRNGVRYFLF